MGRGQSASSGPIEAIVSRRIVFRAASRSEFDEAADWYNLQRPGLGKDFVAEVERVLELVCDQPTLFPIADGDVRVTPIRRFPYALYYRVKPTQIVVIAVFHTSRDPKAWKSRI